MKINFISFVKKLSNLKTDFSTYYFKNKHKSALLSLFESLEFIKQHGTYRNVKNYKKSKLFSEYFKKIEKNLSEEVIQLLIVFSILNSRKLPVSQYNGKALRSKFKTGAPIVTYLLFNNGFLQKKKKTYQFSPFFTHVTNLSPEGQDNFLKALVTYNGREEQQFYINMFRLIKHKPNYINISLNHAIEVNINWLFKYWKKGKDSKKELELEALTKKYRNLIAFKSISKLKTQNKTITVQPRLFLEEKDDLELLILEKIREKPLAYRIIEQNFLNQNYSMPKIYEKLVFLLLDNRIEFSEQLPLECIKLLEFTVDYQNYSITIPITVRLDNDYFNFLRKKGINNPEKHIEELVNIYPAYLRYSPLTAEDSRGILTFKRIAPEDAILTTA